MKSSLRVLLLLSASLPMQARIVRIVIDRVESPTFGGQSFGDTGAYEKIIGRAVGEIDSFHPRNIGITDILLIPRPNGERFIRYETSFYLLKPVNPAKGNGLLFYSAPNRGDKRGFQALRPVRMEFIPSAAVSTWNYPLYPPVESELGKAVLTARAKEADARRVIPSTEWAYGDCTAKPFPGETSKTNLCLRGGFSPDLIYEFIYTGKDPLVIGLGMAATRDLVSWFRYAQTDDTGKPNPLAGAIAAAIGEGQSQPGRFLRTFLDLGFNEDEYRNIVFDGMNPHIASQGAPVNVRFGQPDRSMGQRENAQYPAPEGALTWSRIVDPLAGRLASNLDACAESLTCPKIIQTTSGTEFWQGRMSLNITTWDGKKDIPLPDNVRLYHFSSTQHTPASSGNPGMCQVVQNPAPFFETRRALLFALERWVLEGKEPPPSKYPRISDGTLIPFEGSAAGWPAIPGFKYPPVVSGLRIRDFGPDFDPCRVSGITSIEPPVNGAAYTMLVPKVDADGNEIGGIRSTTIQVPMGTYTGWALRRAGFGEDELCGLTGQSMPFRNTLAERQAAGDPRLSVEERYKDKAAIADAVEKAANSLVAEGYLLPEDAARLIAAAK